MVAKLVLDQLEKTGGALTALTLPVANATTDQYLQNNGSGVLNWATVTAGGVTNIKHTTGTPITLVEADVSGKSATVVSADPSSASIVVLLPALGTTGLSSCIITVLARADATSTYSLVLKDSASTEIWTGYLKGDFVTLCESNGAWLVLDHKETFYSLRQMAANQTISTSALEKLTGNGSGWDNILDYGSMFDNSTNHRIVMPFKGWASVQMAIKASAALNIGCTPAMKAGAPGSPPTIWDLQHVSGNGYLAGFSIFTTRIKLAKDDVIEFWSRNIYSSGTVAVEGNNRNGTQFVCKVERIY